MPRNAEKKRVYDAERYARDKHDILARRAQKYANNRDEARLNRLERWDRFFGWPEGTSEWLVAVSLFCSLCEKPFEANSNRAVFDHNHSDGSFRGLIHSKCNVAIGMLDDSDTLCLKAATYLQRK